MSEVQPAPAKSGKLTKEEKAKAKAEKQKAAAELKAKKKAEKKAAAEAAAKAKADKVVKNAEASTNAVAPQTVKAANPAKESGVQPIVAPPLPISSDKEAQLETLLAKYKTGAITAGQYQAERAKIVANP